MTVEQVAKNASGVPSVWVVWFEGKKVYKDTFAETSVEEDEDGLDEATLAGV